MFANMVSRKAARLFRMLLLTFIIVISIEPAPVQALPKDDPIDPRTCPTYGSVSFNLKLVGFQSENRVLAGKKIEIAASDAKLSLLYPDCEVILVPLPFYKWSLSWHPVGSIPPLIEGSNITVAITPDVAGDYAITFTACPNGCNFSLHGQSFSIPAKQKSIGFTSVFALYMPPDTVPVVPYQTPTYPTSMPDAAIKCQVGGGAVTPAWVTINPWSGAQDYQLVEGRVTRSRISRQDNPTNHESQDVNFYIEPDLKYRYILSTRPEFPNESTILGVEWERNYFPEPFRPTPGDRASVFGYWILDCGHEFYTEIHPPVGVATQRPRAISIPSTEIFDIPDPDNPHFSVGDNVYVPGISTDIWFNSFSGENTSNCNWTGLHQPSKDSITTGACIKSPSPLNRLFEFNIYLPKNPGQVLEDNGFSSIDAPLYVKLFPHPWLPSSGPDPVIQLLYSNNVPYLHVSIDLRGFQGAQYARRIEAAWVYPSEDNWGLRRWKLQLNSINVINDADGFWRGSGDWRFWINTNNKDNEWTKIFDCDDCVHGLETFGGRPFRTGTGSEVSLDRSLGPDLLLFPDQRIWVHTSGFEEDWVISDDTGEVNDLQPQTSASYQSLSYCSPDAPSYCGEYVLNYDILPGSPIGPAKLTAQANAYTSNFLVGSNWNIVDCPTCTNYVANWYPFDITLLSGEINLSSTNLYKAQEKEPFSLPYIGVKELNDKITAERLVNPTQVEQAISEMREETDLWIKQHGANEVALDIHYLQEAIPSDLWIKYFGDLKLYGIYLPSIRR